MTNTIYDDVLQIFLTVTQMFTWFSGVYYDQKNNNKKRSTRSTKNNHLREVNATHFHSPTNPLIEPILDLRGSYTDEKHSFTQRYA